MDIARFLHEHQGQRTVALYVGEKSGFTDYFVITTVRSLGHLRGLVDQIFEVLDAHKLTARRSRRRITDDGWVLIDCGPIIVHLMTGELREFYDLERLWFGSEMVFDGEITGEAAGPGS